MISYILREKLCFFDEISKLHSNSMKWYIFKDIYTFNETKFIVYTAHLLYCTVHSIFLIAFSTYMLRVLELKLYGMFEVKSLSPFTMHIGAVIINVVYRIIIAIKIVGQVENGEVENDYCRS